MLPFLNRQFYKLLKLFRARSLAIELKIIDWFAIIQRIPANSDPVDQPHHCCNQDKNTDTHSKSNPGQCKSCQSYPSGFDLPVEMRFQPCPLHFISLEEVNRHTHQQWQACKHEG